MQRGFSFGERRGECRALLVERRPLQPFLYYMFGQSGEGAVGGQNGSRYESYAASHNSENGGR
jgi:hypothetical protein